MSAAESLSGYCFEILFSIAISALLANLILLMRLKFGSILVTHLSVRPYMATFALFTVMSAEFFSLCFLNNISYHDDQVQFWHDLYSPKSSMRRIYGVMAIIKIDLVILFVLFRTHELENLLVFVFFQRKLRLQDLSVERDTY